MHNAPIGSMARNVSLLAAGLGITLVVAGAARHRPSPVTCVAAPTPAPAIAEPAALRTPDRSAAAPPSCPAAEPAPSCPDPAPAPALQRPELSSPDGVHVVDRGFPALSPDGKQVAVVHRLDSGRVELELLNTERDAIEDGSSEFEPGEPVEGAAPAADAPPAERLAAWVRGVNQRSRTS